MCFKNMFLTAHLMKMKQDTKGSVSKLNEDQLIQRKNGQTYEEKNQPMKIYRWVTNVKNAYPHKQSKNIK